MSTLISIGNARLKVIGLNPQRLTDQGEARFPGHPTFKGMHYQKTGLGEQTRRLEIMTVPHILGGLDALGWLLQHFKNQDEVTYFRLAANLAGHLEGSVVIRDHSIDEDRIHPWSGRGRILTAEIGLLFVETTP
ncbi:hypothetical protein BKI51_21785 [Alphaproteobacteria bacterium AO1-B]|nr:hypothetical protein BKI51_21785 [Alphaproteobacteria bacterium AO1-B]